METAAAAWPAKAASQQRAATTTNARAATAAPKVGDFIRTGILISVRPDVWGQQITGHRVRRIEIFRRRLLDLIRGDGLDALRPILDIPDRAAGGQSRSVEPRHAGLVVTRED